MQLPNKVLIIDDDIDDMQFLCMALNQLDGQIQVYSEPESERAVTKLANHVIPKPDIIFLDLNMPRMNGWMCLKAIKGVPGYNSIPVVILTTSAFEKDKVSTAELGAAHFLTKANSYKILLSKISDLFSKNWQ